MEIFEAVRAQADINELKKEETTKRKIVRNAFLDLQKYATEILTWARCKGGSKRKIQRLLLTKFGLKVSADRVYRFVKKINGGKWPNSRNKSI